MEPHRAERVSAALREELAEIIGYELSDPRIGLVSITDVEVSPDLRHALVRVGQPEDPAQDLQETLQALEKARHFLRRELSNRLQLYRVPDLHFEADAVVDRTRLEHIMKRIQKGRPRTGSTADEKKSVE